MPNEKSEWGDTKPPSPEVVRALTNWACDSRHLDASKGDSEVFAAVTIARTALADHDRGQNPFALPWTWGMSNDQGCYIKDCHNRIIASHMDEDVARLFSSTPGMAEIITERLTTGSRELWSCLSKSFTACLPTFRSTDVTTQTVFKRPREIHPARFRLGQMSEGYGTHVKVFGHRTSAERFVLEHYGGWTLEAFKAYTVKDWIESGAEGHVLLCLSDESSQRRFLSMREIAFW